MIGHTQTTQKTPPPTFEIVGEIYESDDSLLDSVEFCMQALRDAARSAGLEIRAEASHQFTPQGVTGVLILAESHIIISTWPEYDYAAVDIYSCTTPVSCVRALSTLAAEFRSGRVEGHLLTRPEGAVVSFKSLEEASAIVDTSSDFK